MTAPNGPILFNSSTGSDTLSSGLGPASPVNGSSGSCTSGSAVVTGINTTGVSAGDLFWGNTSAGRRFSIIASVDSGTQVTLDDTLGATHSGNLTWAIGGKRATLGGSINLIDDGSTGNWKAGWIVEFESGHTETIASTIVLRESGDSTDGPLIIRGTSGAATKPVLTFSNNGVSIQLNGNYICLQDFELQNSNATKTASKAVRFAAAVDGITVDGLSISDSTNNFWRGIGLQGDSPKIVNCHIANCAEDGISDETSMSAVLIANNKIHDNAGDGIDLSSNGQQFGVCIYQNLIYDNTGDGIYLGPNTDARNASHVIGNIIYSNGGDGIQSVSAGGGQPHILHNIITENGGYGVNAQSGWSDAVCQLIAHNAFYNNTSGEITGATGENNTTLAADPFENAASGDFNLNNTSGGGAALRAVSVEI